MDHTHRLGTLNVGHTIVLEYGDATYRVEVLDNGAVRLESGEVVAPPRKARSVIAADTRWVFLEGETYEFHVARGVRRSAGGHHGSLTAPMPATVIRVNVSAGDQVRRGDTLIVLEAMKMELPVRAPSDVRVAAIHCREGDLVQPGVTLLEIED